jgi:hypothetical protein
MVETIQAGKYTVKQAYESFSFSFEQKVVLNQLETV